MSQNHIPPGQPTRTPDGDTRNVLPERALGAWVVRTLDRGRSPLMTAPIHGGREEEYIYRTWGPTSLILAAHLLPVHTASSFVPYNVQQALPCQYADPACPGGRHMRHNLDAMAVLRPVGRQVFSG